MKIARFESEAEMKEFFGAVRMQTGKEYFNYWIGANDFLKTGDYRWAPDNSPVNYHIEAWWGGKSNETAKQPFFHIAYCLALVSRPGEMKVFKYSCNKTFHYICQKSF
jgi:hypothetical protein